MGSQSIHIRSDGKEDGEVALEKKMFGYGVYDSEHKNVLMMGGYCPESGE